MCLCRQPSVLKFDLGDVYLDPTLLRSSDKSKACRFIIQTSQRNVYLVIAKGMFLMAVGVSKLTKLYSFLCITSHGSIYYAIDI